MNSKIIAAVCAALVVGLAAGYYYNGNQDDSLSRGWGGGMMGWGNQAGRYDLDDENEWRGMGMMYGGGRDRGSCVGEECLYVDDLEYPVGELSEPAKSALDTAIADEYNARATYAAVLEKLGQVRPFSMIIRSEEQHISLLKAIYDKYGLTPPADTAKASLEGVKTLQDACQVGVDAEIANADMYKKDLLPVVTGYDDITAVFRRLMDTSEDMHLQAFERCN